MITAGEIVKDLENVKKKTEFSRITYPKNDIWPKVTDKLEEIIKLLKTDIRLFGYDKK